MAIPGGVLPLHRPRVRAQYSLPQKIFSVVPVPISETTLPQACAVIRRRRTVQALCAILFAIT
jgi:hypothetical protein